VGLSVEDLVASWKRSLRQRNLADRTIETYVDSGLQFASWLESEQRITDVDAVTRDHVADFITHLIETNAPAPPTAAWPSATNSELGLPEVQWTEAKWPRPPSRWRPTRFHRSFITPCDDPERRKVPPRRPTGGCCG
jgi:hypothetical protein